MPKDRKIYHTLEDVLNYFKNVKHKASKEEMNHQKKMKGLSLTERINYNNYYNKQRRVLDLHEEK
jgi:hypothetical protein